MIIDFSRNFTDEELVKYDNIVEAWGIDQEDNDYISWENKEWIKDLSTNFRNLVERLRRDKWIIHTRHVSLKMLMWFERRNISYYFVYNPHPDGKDVLAIKCQDDNAEYKIVEYGKQSSFPKSSMVDQVKFLENRGWTKIEMLIGVSTFQEAIQWAYDKLSGMFIIYDGYDLKQFDENFDDDTDEQREINRTKRIMLFEIVEDATLFKIKWA